MGRQTTGLGKRLAQGDRRDYVLAPGCSLEDGAPGWQLRGTSVVAGNQSFHVGSRSHSKALRLDGRVVVRQRRQHVRDHQVAVAFRFRSIGAGSWWVDDFYVDPRRTT